MPPCPVHNFKTQKYDENEPKSNGVSSRNSLSKIRHGVYVIKSWRV